MHHKNIHHENKKHFSRFNYGHILSFILSCHKNESNTTTSGQMAPFFQQTQVQSQTFAVTAGQFSQVTGAKSTQLYIYPGSLVLPNGNAATGSVQVELKELYTHGDMILSNATTTSGSQLLQSGGELYITATQNGQNLLINHNSPIQAYMPATGNGVSGMQRFTGQVVSNNTAAGNMINWGLLANDTALAPLIWDSAQGGMFLAYAIAIDSFGWTNCDQFPTQTNGGADVGVQLPTGFDNTNTSVYMIFNAANTIAPADRWSAPIYKFHSGENTPLGLNISIVAVSQKGTNYYYSILQEVTSAGAVYSITMTQAPLSTIKTAIAQL